jgi:hypothetical protein
VRYIRAVEFGWGRSRTLSGTFDEQVVQVVVVAPGFGEGCGVQIFVGLSIGCGQAIVTPSSDGKSTRERRLALFGLFHRSGFCS